VVCIDNASDQQAAASSVPVSQPSRLLWDSNLETDARAGSHILLTTNKRDDEETSPSGNMAASL
jgi:hypothetical protein